MPFFSVVIPLYNKEMFIEHTLKSVLAQTFADFDVIIVNDGSTDGSDRKIVSFDDVRIRYYSRKNQGASAARNFGIEQSTSDFITFIDADDFWYPNFLETMHRNITDFPNEKVFSAAIETQTARTTFPSQYSVVKTGEREVVDYFAASFKETVICTSCAAFHKSVFEKSGNFDTNIKSGQDTDLWIRIGLHYRVVFDWKILATYVFDAHSLSKNKAYNSSRIRFEKYADAEKNHPQLKKFLDLNRFSIAIKSKINGDMAHFRKLFGEIDFRNLSAKKKFLLSIPAFTLRVLIKLRLFLTESRLASGVFK